MFVHFYYNLRSEQTCLQIKWKMAKINEETAKSNQPRISIKWILNFRTLVHLLITVHWSTSMRSKILVVGNSWSILGRHHSQVYLIDQELVLVTGLHIYCKAFYMQMPNFGTSTTTHSNLCDWLAHLTKNDTLRTLFKGNMPLNVMKIKLWFSLLCYYYQMLLPGYFLLNHEALISRQTRNGAKWLLEVFHRH